MHDETERSIADAAALPLRPLDADRLARRVRQLRRRRRMMRGLGALGLTSAVALSGWAIVATGDRDGRRVTPASTVSRYVISDVSVSAQRSDLADVAFSVRWSGQSFPGIYDCTVTVYDSAGRVAGTQVVRQMRQVRPGPGTLSVDVDVDAPPATADVDCGARLDDPNGRYLVHDVTVSGDGGPGSEVVVKFDREWTGNTDVPGVALCDVTVYSSDGDVLLSDQTVYWSESPARRSVPLSRTLGTDATGTPASADVRCTPYTG